MSDQSSRAMPVIDLEKLRRALAPYKNSRVRPKRKANDMANVPIPGSAQPRRLALITPESSCQRRTIREDIIAGWRVLE